MAFIDDDELFILMDFTGERDIEMTVDELKMMRDAGIKTCLWLGPVWAQWTSNDFKSLNWSQFDDYKRRMEQAGMKSLIMCWQENTKAYPADYYVVMEHRRRVFGAFSIWNPRAMEAYLKSLRLVRDRMTSDTCQVVSGLFDGGGERVLRNFPAYYDEHAQRDWEREHTGNPNHKTPEGSAWLKESYINALMNIQEVLTDTQHREIWYMLARYKATRDHLAGHGCEWVDDYLEAWKTLEPKTINHISYNFFPYGRQFWNVIVGEKERHGVNEFVGAEYCEGLQQGNGKKALEMGLRMIISPKHKYTGHRTIEPWMAEQIRQHVEVYQNDH